MSLPFEIRLRKSVPALAAALLFMLAGPVIGYPLYWYRGAAGLHETVLAQILLFASPVLFFALFQVRLTSWLGKLVRLMLLPGAAFICLWLWEILGGNSVFRLAGDMLALNYALMLVPFLAFHALLGDVRRSVPLAFSVITFAGYAYHCATLFRGAPILPSDLAALPTALAVAGTYDYPFDRTHYMAISLCISLWLGSRTLPRRSDFKVISVLERLVSLAAVCAASFVLVSTPTVQRMGVSISQWPTDITDLVLSCGSLAKFSVHLYGIQEPKPAGYDPQELEKTILAAPQPKSLLAQELDTKPNIIVIMNESFADLNDALGVTTDVDPMPFVHSLSENAIKGDMYVAVHGGGTCNTEYEFLTGNALYPNSTSMAFYQIVKDSMPSVAHLLKAQGYTTIAMHPADGDNYHRNDVYRYLGFDTFYDLASFAGAERFRPSFYYPSDRACYEKIKTLYTEKGEDERLFVFNVTMQNHSSYNAGGTEPTVSVTQSVSNENQLNEYLRCVKESDTAFSELVEYFSAQEEPTIILFFGDHQPSLTYDGAKGEMAEKTQVKSMLAHYVTPYVIWANYDIVEADVPETSPNYLASLLLSCTNVEMSSYEAYLLDVMQRYPVLTRLGYADAAGTYTAYDILLDFPEDLANVYGAAYNRSYDPKNRLSLWDIPSISPM